MNLREMVRWAASGVRAGRAAQAAVQQKSAASSLADMLFRLGFSPDPPVSGALDNPFGQHPTAYRAIQAFARNVAAMPYELFKAGTDDVVENHPLGRLFERPNALMRGTQLFEALTIDLEAYGNAYWWLGPPARANGAGLVLPSSIRRLDPRKTKVRLDDADVPEFYEVSTQSRTLKIPADEVIHFKYWNPVDESCGMSWTQPAQGEIELDYQAGRWNRGFFRRGAEPGFMLVPQDGASVSQESAERFRQSWIAKHGGIDRSHVPDILSSGLKVERTGIGQREMEFNQGRRFSRENTLSTAGVPPAIAGILEYANYANMMPQLRIFFHLELLPRLAYIEDVIQSDLLDRFKTGLDGFFKTETIKALADEIDANSQAAERLWHMGVPLIHLNDRFGMGFDLEGVEGADQPWGGETAPQAGGIGQSAPGAGAEQDSPPPPKPGQAEEDDPEDQGRVIRPRAWRTSQLDAVWRGLVNRVHDLELQAESRWRTHVRNLRDEVLKNLPTLKSLQGRIVNKDEAARPLFELNEANDEAIVSLEPIWRAAMMRGADTIADQVGISVDFHFTDPEVMKLLSNRRQEIRDVNERMLSDLHETLAEGLAQQETEEDLRRRVLDFFGGERANARTVARTETFSSYSGGRFEAMREAGVSRHRWVTARDSRVRESHADVDPSPVIVGSPFSNGLLYPHDPSGLPGEVINCFPAGVVVSGAAVAALRVEYIGPMLEVTTRAGHRLTVTPNHPVLTPETLLPARALREGDYLLCQDPMREAALSSRVVDDRQKQPSPIEQVFDALRLQSRTAHRKVSADQLHGDAFFAKGNIEVVLADGQLLHGIDAEGSKSQAERILVSAAVGQAKISGYRPSLPPVHRVAGTAAGGPSLRALPADGIGIGTQGGPLRQFRLGAAAHVNAPLPKAARYDTAIYSEFRSKLLDAASGLITLDQIVAVREFEFRGHVYDLQSANGWIVAQNLITSNCRCVTIPEVA